MLKYMTKTTEIVYRQAPHKVKSKRPHSYRVRVVEHRPYSNPEFDVCGIFGYLGAPVRVSEADSEIARKCSVRTRHQP